MSNSQAVIRCPLALCVSGLFFCIPAEAVEHLIAIAQFSTRLGGGKKEKLPDQRTIIISPNAYIGKTRP
ncbi:hypothetical protein [Burkholderia sp. lig30]|uniref:hypothetical protein n=1 Tax=Burkholderia sp. lig30 TaxID=1192124 RepID=UPI0013656EBD|nr:hypothetical protein [Burkholderia sp. lig30]